MLRALRRGRLSGRFQFKEPTPVRIPLQYRLLCRTYVQQLLRMFHNPWQPDRECRAATDLAFDCDVSSHHLAEAAADDEAKACTPYLREVAEEAWENSWNSLPICSGVMPMPVSVSASVIQSRPFSCPS